MIHRRAVHELKAKFLNATITHGGLRWIGGILYVDDLWRPVSDLNRCPRTPDDDKHLSDLERKGPNATQHWQNENYVFETTQVRNARKKPRKVQGKSVWPAPFRILSMFPCYTNPNARPHTYPVFVSTPLQEVKQIDYLGLRLDPMLTMKPAVASIQEKAKKGHSLALAVSFSLRYDKHHSNPTLCQSPVEMLNLWKSCVLPHF